jgi:hypothetical protein
MSDLSVPPTSSNSANVLKRVFAYLFWSRDPDVQTTLYFSLFLVVFPLAAVIWYLIGKGALLLSPAMLMMFASGVLAFRGAKHIERRRGV